MHKSPGSRMHTELFTETSKLTGPRTAGDVAETRVIQKQTNKPTLKYGGNSQQGGEVTRRTGDFKATSIVIDWRRNLRRINIMHLPGYITSDRPTD